MDTKEQVITFARKWFNYCKDRFAWSEGSNANNEVFGRFMVAKSLFLSESEDILSQYENHDKYQFMEMLANRYVETCKREEEARVIAAKAKFKADHFIDFVKAFAPQLSKGEMSVEQLHKLVDESIAKIYGDK